MQRRPFTLNVFKGFSALSLMLSPIMFVVGCGADPASETSPTTSDTSAEAAPASGGSGTSTPPPADGSDKK